MKTVTAREANRDFAKILRGVEGGEEFLVTRNGVAVARIVSARADGTRALTPAQEGALARSMERLRRGWDLGGGQIDRDALQRNVLRRELVDSRASDHPPPGGKPWDSLAP